MIFYPSTTPFISSRIQKVVEDGGVYDVKVLHVHPLRNVFLVNQNSYTTGNFLHQQPFYNILPDIGSKYIHLIPLLPFPNHFQIASALYSYPLLGICFNFHHSIKLSLLLSLLNKLEYFLFVLDLLEN